MPSSPPNPPDDFCAAALRFYDDATVLLWAERNDGAVYLTGYVQECSLKASLQASPRLSAFRGRDLGHEMEALHAPELFLQAALGLRTRRALGAAMTKGRVIDHGHPNRRYWANHWSKVDAHDALDDATTVLRELIVRPMLDTGWALP